MAGTRKSRYAAEQNLKAFFWKHGIVYYWTFTFAENLGDKALAEERFKPLKDLIRRKKGDELHFWELQERGAWHVHLVTNRYLDVKWLRPWMVERGWGPIMKVIRVESPTRYQPGQGWIRDHQGEERLIRYLLKYLTKAFSNADTKTKPWGGTKDARPCTTSFKWVPWVNANSMLWAFGVAEFFEIFGRLSTFRDVHLCIRLGYELSNWPIIDPWFCFT